MRSDRVQLAVPELLDWLAGSTPLPTADPHYPLSLVNGQRRKHNANQILRPPAWRKTDPDGALRVRADDLAAVGADAGDWVAVVTRTGRIVVRAEIDDSLRRGQVALPHGFGMSYPDGHGGRVTDGPRINMITDAGDRDPDRRHPAPQGRPRPPGTGHGHRAGGRGARPGPGPAADHRRDAAMSDAVIVDVVRTRRARASPAVRCPACTRSTCWRTAPGAGRAQRARPGRWSTTSSAAASARSASRALNIARTAVLAAGLPGVGTGHHHRPAVRLEPAGRAFRRPGRHRRRLRHRDRLRRGVDEPGADGLPRPAGRDPRAAASRPLPGGSGPPGHLGRAHRRPLEARPGGSSTRSRPRSHRARPPRPRPALRPRDRAGQCPTPTARPSRSRADETDPRGHDGRGLAGLKPAFDDRRDGRSGSRRSTGASPPATPRR